MAGINGSLSHSLWVMDCGVTKFGLGADIQSPTGLFYFRSRCIVGQMNASDFGVKNVRIKGHDGLE